MSSLNRSSRQSRRCLKACVRCRDMKVRCSGTSPCARCQRSRETCIFRDPESRVSIPRSYLRSLEDKARDNASPTATSTTASGLPSSLGIPLAPARPARPRASPSPSISQTPSLRNDENAVEEAQAQTGQAKNSERPSAHAAHPTNLEDSHQRQILGTESDFRKNPLIEGNETFIIGSDGKAWFLGPTSSWSFCWRVLALLTSRLPEPVNPPDPWTLSTFELSWSPVGWDNPPVIDDLPAQDYATLLVHSLKYHLGTLSPIIDDENFFKRLDRLYEDPEAEARNSPLWYAQFLLVIAFGQAVVNKEGTYPVPGTHYAARGLSLIPNIFRRNKDSILVVETLSLAALYLQSLDLRLESYQMIGQALRMCTAEGFHRHAAASEIGEHPPKRYGILFWITYILDRHFSALVGTPSSIRDEDITAKLPSQIHKSTWANSMTFHIRLSRLTAEILAGVYGVDTQFDDTLLVKTQDMLQKIASISEELNNFLKLQTHGTTTELSRIGTRLLLSYHHCIVLTTRPLVMCVVKRVFSGHGHEDTLQQTPINLLLQTCVDSASAILSILTSLNQSDQLDSFIPFQVEELFSSAFLLHVIGTLVPLSRFDRSHLPAAYAILDHMIAKGSHAARIRQKELQRLDWMLNRVLQPPAQLANNAGPSNQQPTSEEIESFQLNATGEFNQANNAIADWDPYALEASFHISPSGLLSLAEELNFDNFMSWS